MISPPTEQHEETGPTEEPSIAERLRVEYWPVGRLKPYDRNPRKNDKAVDRIRASIREFGFAVPNGPAQMAPAQIIVRRCHRKARHRATAD
jgi:hypothetical protein